MKQKIIGIDLDDVLLDFNSTLCGFINKKYETALSKKDIHCFDLDVVWKCTRIESLRRVQEFYETEDHAGALPIAGAQKAIQKLSSMYSLLIITSKPDSMAQETSDWVCRHFGKAFDGIYFGNHFHGNGVKRKKSEICEELGVNILIDDSLINAIDVARHNREVLLFDAPWNQLETEIENISRVSSWDDILTKLS
ncbi:MAG: hypothetical protein M3Q80_01790 [bacterium]|nr:hypothetical protein [bacterium]